MEGQINRESMEYIRDLAPDFERWVLDFVFKEVWSRPGLDQKARQLCIIAADTALGNEVQLKSHIATALISGATKEEIVEVILLMAVYAGFPAAWNGLIAAKDVFTGQSK